MESRSHQVIRDMKHDHFPDEQGARAERYRLEQPALETYRCLGQARGSDVNGGRCVQIGGDHLACIRWKIRRGNIHGTEQILRDQIDHELSASLDVSGSVLRRTIIAKSDTDGQIQGLTSNRVKEAARRKFE